MESIIDELYYGDLSSALLFRWTSEHKRDSAKYTKAADRFRETLDGGQVNTYNALEQQMLTLTCHETKEYFRMGFYMGARIMMEVMQFEER